MHHLATIVQRNLKIEIWLSYRQEHYNKSNNKLLLSSFQAYIAHMLAIISHCK